jgi:hypothetical protein
MTTESMTTESMTRIDAVEGVEIWKLARDGAERFAVRLSDRRARLVGSLAAAQTMAAKHLHHTRLARAH